MNTDTAFTIARDERIVNQRVADIIRAEVFTGVELVKIGSRTVTKNAEQWYQVVVTGPRLPFTTAARFANSPIDSTNTYACDCGDTLGHALVSEAHVERPRDVPMDVMTSLQFEGSASGMIVPRRTMFVSPRFRSAMIKHKVRGWDYEVAFYDG